MQFGRKKERADRQRYTRVDERHLQTDVHLASAASTRLRLNPGLRSL